MDPEALTTSIIALTDSLAARLPLEAAVASYLDQAHIVGVWERAGAIFTGILTVLSIGLSFISAMNDDEPHVIGFYFIAAIVLGILSWHGGMAAHTALSNPTYWALQQVLP